jgi:hypothetical protein
VNRACSDLCGGCAVMRIPTANEIGGAQPRQLAAPKETFVHVLLGFVCQCRGHPRHCCSLTWGSAMAEVGGIEGLLGAEREGVDTENGVALSVCLKPVQPTVL